MTITVDQYRDAIANALSDDQIRVLRTLYKFPNSTASTKELAAALNYKSFHAANSQVGQIGKEIANYLKITPPTYYDGELERPAYFLLIGPYHSREGKTRGQAPGWEMVENLRRALETLQPRTTAHAYLFVWNPNRWDWETLEDDIVEVNQTGNCAQGWSCGVNKSIRQGDRAFLIRVGTEPKGIMGAGFVTSEPSVDKHWSGEDKEALYVDINFETLLNPGKEPILSLDALRTGTLAAQNWIPQASGISVRPELVDELEALWFNFITTQDIRHNPFLASEQNRRSYTEGTANRVTQTKYERNPYARKACIAHYGHSCMVWGFNFHKAYGELGKGFIHVHHLAQIAKVGKRHTVDPVEHLRPVCPNCHAMLHRREEGVSIEELKSLLAIGSGGQ